MSISIVIVIVTITINNDLVEYDTTIINVVLYNINVSIDVNYS